DPVWLNRSGGHKPFVLVNYSPTICLNWRRMIRPPRLARAARGWHGVKRHQMVAPLQLLPPRSAATRRTALGLVLGAPLLAGCAGIQSTFSQITSSPPGQGPDQQ